MLRKLRGFTILECLIVVSILGILAAVAIPAYQQYERDMAMRKLVPQPVLQAYLAKADFMLLPGVDAIDCDNYRRPEQVFTCVVSMTGEGRGRGFGVDTAALGLPALSNLMLLHLEKTGPAGFEVKAHVDRATVAPDVAGKAVLAMAQHAQTQVVTERAEKARALASEQAKRDSLAAVAKQQTDANSPNERAWAEAEKKLTDSR